MNKKLTVIAGVLVLAFLGFVLLILPPLIDKEAVKSQVVTTFKSVTGLTLEIQGDVAVQVFPLPHVTINSLFVRNAPSASSSFLLKIKSLDIRPTLTSVLGGGKPVIENITARGVGVDIERLKNGEMNWQDSNVQSGAGSSVLVSLSSAMVSSIDVSDTVMHYTDKAAKIQSEYTRANMHLTLSPKGESSLKVNFLYNDTPFVATGSCSNFAQMIAGTSPLKLDVVSGKNHFIYQGEMGFKDKNFFIQGSSSLTADDIVPWVALLVGDNSKVTGSPTYKPLPLELKSDITTESGKIIFPNLSLDGTAIKGHSKLSLTLPYHVDVQADFSSIDLETLIASQLLSLRTSGTGSNEEMVFSQPKTFFDKLSVASTIAIADAAYNQQHIKDVKLDFDLANGEMSISQAVGVLPGNSRVIFTGIGKDGFQGFALEGELDVTGDSFTDAISIFKSKGFTLPADDFKRFKLKTNAVISGTEIRLSELAARIENIGVVGGVIARLTGRTKLEAALRIGGLNLDHFVDLWGFKEWQASLSNDSPAPKKDAMMSTWLNHMDYDLKLNSTLESYTLNGVVQNKTDFRLEATQGRVALNDVRTSYNGSDLSGDLVINVTKPLPHIDLNATVDTMDIDTFFSTKPPPATTPQAADSPKAVASANKIGLSHEQLNFHWLELLTATYHLKFGHLKWGQFSADALDVKGNIDNRTLTADTLTANMFGGGISLKGNLTGEKIPALSVSGNAVALGVEQLTTLFPSLEGMSGKFNLSLRLNTNGVDVYNWISNLDGMIGMSGSEVLIRGFNLPGIVRAVSYVRTVADILDVVKLAFPGGNTVFSRMEGEWVINGGVFKSLSTKLANSDADGLLATEVDMVNRKIKGRLTLGLKTLDPLHPPSMAVLFTGDMDNPEKTLDTRSLEQYVTSKTSERMLNQYGTH